MENQFADGEPAASNNEQGISNVEVFWNRMKGFLRKRGG